jgi:hypothetical protein
VAALTRIADDLGVDELMLTTIMPDYADRVRSYELVSHAVQSTPVSAP